MTGDASVPEADDVVQEAFGRLMSVGLDDIADTRAWLTVVRRLCLNRLSSAYKRRESAAGAAPLDDAPATVAGPPPGDPADHVTLDEQVRRALAVVLEELSPAERTAFVLHDIFGFPYAEIGEIVGRTSTNCRQLASRARRAVRSSPPSRTTADATSPSSTEHQRVVERFVAACTNGDVAGLLAVLDPGVVGQATVAGGRRLGGGTGATNVVKQVMYFIGPETGTRLVPVFGENGVDVVSVAPDGIRGVLTFHVTGGRIVEIRVSQLPHDAAPG